MSAARCLPDSLLRLGNRVRVFQSCFLNPTRPLFVGDDSGVGGRSSIFTHASWQSAFEGFPVTFEPVTIGNNVWLPWHVFILPGVEIGDNATIAAGSVVMRSIPPSTLSGGVPARVMIKDDKWPSELTDDKRWHIATEMLAELHAYLRDQGVECAQANSVLHLTWKGSSRKVELVREAITSGSDITIALSATERALASGSTVFDLLGRRKGGPTDPITREVEEFLWRYGVRFVPYDETAATE